MDLIDLLRDPLHGDGYQWWSGIGSGSPIFAGLILFLKHRNCHVKGCWRLSRHQVGPYRVCSRHHPSVPDEISVEHVEEAHKENV